MTPLFYCSPKLVYFIHEYACLRLNIPPIFVRNLRKTRTTVGTCSTVARSTVVLPKVAIGIYILANFSAMTDLSGLRQAYS